GWSTYEGCSPVTSEHSGEWGCDVEIYPSLDTHGPHRHYQRCDPRRLVRETRERAAGASNFYGYRCPAVRCVHLAAPAHLETCVSRSSDHYWSGVAWDDSRL